MPTPASLPDDAVAVLTYWYGHANIGDATPEAKARWFAGGEAIDQTIRTQFADTLAAAQSGTPDNWAQNPLGRLALIITLDQFSRNIHRHSAKAFANDALALQHSQAAVAGKQHECLAAQQRVFMVMPMMHAESLAALNRPTTEPEARYLAAQPTRFGQ